MQGSTGSTDRLSPCEKCARAGHVRRGNAGMVPDAKCRNSRVRTTACTSACLRAHMPRGTAAGNGERLRVYLYTAQPQVANTPACIASHAACVTYEASLGVGERGISPTEPDLIAIATWGGGQLNVGALETTRPSCLCGGGVGLLSTVPPGSPPPNNTLHPIPSTLRCAGWTRDDCRNLHV